MADEPCQLGIMNRQIEPDTGFSSWKKPVFCHKRARENAKKDGNIVIDCADDTDGKCVREPRLLDRGTVKALERFTGERLYRFNGLTLLTFLTSLTALRSLAMFKP